MRSITAFVSCITLSFFAIAGATPIQMGTTGHFYEVIDIDGGLNWEGAKSAAEALSYNGASGHLVTITSAEENLFLTTAFGAEELHYHYMGAYQPEGSIEPSGGWAWVTGEEWSYTNWWGWPNGEPNNDGNNENVGIFDHGVVTDNGKSWNDLNGIWNANGYVVEYECTSVPEPSLIILVSMGIASLSAIGYRRRNLKQ